MKRSQIVWTPESATRLPEGAAKTRARRQMMFAGLADQKDREDVVAFLATLGAPSVSPSAADSQTPQVPHASN